MKSSRISNLSTGAKVAIAVIVFGLVAGLGIGLYIAWIVWPVQVTNVDISDLNSGAQEDYILLVAQTYSYDQDLGRARERLQELNDPAAVDRVANLALAYSSQNRAEAVQLAALAVAMGSRNEGVARLAATPTVPVAVAVTPTSTPTAVLPTLMPTLTPTTALAFTRTPTRRVAATSTRTAPPVVQVPPTIWLPPDLATGWPGGVRYKSIAPSVPPGRQFWHLDFALYCDESDKRNDCPNRPGGNTGTNIYIKLIGPSRNRIEAPLILNGSPATEEVKSPNDSCDCNYSYLADGRVIQIGNAPSDEIGGLALRSVSQGGRPQAHVRYFLTFQLLTR